MIRLLKDVLKYYITFEDNLTIVRSPLTFFFPDRFNRMLVVNELPFPSRIIDVKSCEYHDFTCHYINVYKLSKIS